MSELMSLARRLVILNRHMMKRIDVAMEPYGHGGGTYFYLVAILYNNGCTQQELSDKLRINKAATARTLVRLEADGYIERRKLPENQREVRVYYTQKTEKFVAQIQQVIEPEMQDLLAPLGDKERRAFASILTKLVTLPQETTNNDNQCSMSVLAQS